MSLNWREINQVLGELCLEGYFIQDIRQTDYQNTYLNLYKTGSSLWLRICLTQGKTRLHTVSRKPSFPKKPPRFVEFLRARILGGKVQKAAQWGRERIVELEVGTSEGVTTLWIRLWGGASNILVTGQDRTILEAAYRRPDSSEVKGSPVKLPPLPEYSGEDDGRFPLRDLPGEGSFNQRLEAWYEGPGAEEDLEKTRIQVLGKLEAGLKSLEETLKSRQLRREEYRRKDDWKTYGDMLSAFAHEILPGQDHWTGEDFRDGSTVSLPLDPQLTPLENARKYYRLYAKARDGETHVEEEILRLNQDIAAQQELIVAVKETEDLLFLKKQQKKLSPVPQEKSGAELPGLEFQSGAFRILVGRTARENDELLRRHVRGSDVWLHTRDVPGGYVFIKVPKEKSVPLETLLDAGNLAVHYSKAKSDGQADLYYTAVKYLRRAKDGPVGLVLPTQEKNLHVRIDPRRMERLQSSRKGGDNHD